MKRFVLGIAVILVIGLGALSIFAQYQKAEAAELHQKLLVQKKQAEEEKMLPADSLTWRDSDRKERPPRCYEINSDE